MNAEPQDPGQNRLRHAKSPYLLQHARNPVDWYPWGDEAFSKAKEEDKPIFLSIGYSTCHWCHVMARESFQDPDVARLLNETFVNIKVDREERPDIDQVYMTVAQVMTGSGGWPLTILMTPDKLPFYAATYIPKESRPGMVGLLDLVPRIREIWRSQRDTAVNSAREVMAALERAAPQLQGEGLERSILDDAYYALNSRFDRYYGGFSPAPKFPAPHTILFLLRYHNRTFDPNALFMAEKTLQGMRRGGIYDQVGFGFHRYATDGEWLVPHFEKMLYDQALLAMAYAEAYQVTGAEEYEKTAREILHYVLRDMTGPEGEFYSAEDADSEGVEGKFYLWTREEVFSILGDEEAGLFCQYYGIRSEGNFRDAGHGVEPRQNIPHIVRSRADLAARFRTTEDTLAVRLERARKRLFQARERRAHPARDDKILTDWNGLMIAALARAGWILDDAGYLDAAGKAAAFILATLYRDGELLHRYRDGEASIPGFLDDHAFLAWGLIELYEATFQPAHLESALKLQDAAIARFWDPERGGFFFTTGEEGLPLRRKESHDGAIPSGNAVSLSNLLRLGRLTGDAELEERALELVQAFAPDIRGSPASHLHMLSGLDFMIGPSHEVVIAGGRDAGGTREMMDALRRYFLPHVVVLIRPEDAGPITRIAPFTESMRGTEGKATAYVCVQHACQVPATDASTLIRNLDVRELHT